MNSATGVATINFGAGSNEASAVVTGQLDILATSKASAFVMADDTSVNHSASDHRYFGALAGLTCGTPVEATGFTIYATSQHNLSGQFTVRWVWVN